MADKAIGELPIAPSLNDDSLLVVEQQSEARSITGALVKSYAVAALKTQTDAAKASADAAKKSADEAAEKAKDAADVALHPPKIQGGNWWTWDTAKNDYVDSGVDAGVSLSIAETVTGAPGDPAKVENVGTATDPKLKFTIPLGNQGPVSSVNGGTGDVVIGGRNYLLLTGSIKAELTGTGKSQDVYASFDTSLSLDELLAGQYVLSADCVLKDAVGEQGASMAPRAYLYVVAYYADGTPHELFSSTENFTYGQGSVTKNTKMVVNMDFAPYLSNGITSVLIRATIQRLVSGYACISKVKLEVGNVATDWTPAPEDKADVPLQFDIKLPASGWASGSQTVTDARFITGDNIDWDVDVKGACIPWDGITITEGQMVAKADIVPTTDMTWTVTRREVRRDG